MSSTSASNIELDHLPGVKDGVANAIDVHAATDKLVADTTPGGPRVDRANTIGTELGRTQQPEEANEHDGRAEPAGSEGADQPDGPDEGGLTFWGMPNPRAFSPPPEEQIEAMVEDIKAEVLAPDQNPTPPPPPSSDAIEEVWGNLGAVPNNEDLAFLHFNALASQ